MRTLITEQQLRDGVAQLAGTISNTYRGEPLTIIGILQDSIVLLADLMRSLDIPSQMRVIQAYAEHTGPDKPGHLDVDGTTAAAVRDRHVLLVDDLFDTGYTLLETICQLDDLQQRSIRSAVLLQKQGRREVAQDPDYVAFEIPNEIVVGYGLDYHGRYRHLPYIAALEPHELQENESNSLYGWSGIDPYRA